MACSAGWYSYSGTLRRAGILRRPGSRAVRALLRPVSAEDAADPAVGSAHPPFLPIGAPPATSSSSSATGSVPASMCTTSAEKSLSQFLDHTAANLPMVEVPYPAR